MRKYLILVIALAQGCAATTWYKDGSSQSEFNMDRAQCQASSYMVPSNGSLAQSLNQVAYYQACMQGKGWRAG